MIFLSPIYFLGLLLIPIVVFLDYRKRKQGVYFRSSETLQKIYAQSVWKNFYLPLVLKIVIIALFVSILANPVMKSVREEVSKKGIDIAIVFDISKSMLAEDIKPNRIEAAKKVMADFVGHFTSDRLAVVLFAGKPFLSTPLTFDYTALVDAVERITTDSIRQDVPGLSGTAIGDGLLVAMDTLEKGDKNTKDSKRQKVIILLTDGEANMGVNPTVVAKLAAEKSIKIYTIGLGDPAGTDLYVTDQFGNKQYFRDQDGKPIRATLDEKTLTFIADTTRAKYYNAKDTKALDSVFNELAKLTKTEVKTTSVTLYYPLYEIFLWGILLLLPFWLYLSFRRENL
ncbi:MAG: VWA domain-containing protein [Candidatus Gracilibacteria bacterium]|nr:VWA domain-containing protein [Candidatus Gracilibacteria bacterium]